MTNSTVRSLLHHAAAAIRLGNLTLALRLVSNAETLASADRTIPADRLGHIRTARLALAIAN
ncbi:hypothetical protein [Bradyrhizobium erythrophlei]|uniref:hypothetical protein n=1 Tax=Bradyrhizobium erythrophlei TaxID=1437360 RepID=UPI00115FBEC0|nr:hypothetical protein [Bradyrhizobium erythrophlei]